MGNTFFSGDWRADRNELLLLLPKLSDEDDDTVTVAMLLLLPVVGDIVKVRMIVGDDVMNVLMSF
jgi:hypothetical protein